MGGTRLAVEPLQEERMHKLRRMAAVTAVAITAALTVTAVPALTATTALADPVNGSGKAVAPQSYDVVSVGADTDEFLFDQLSGDYNATIPAKKHGPNDPYFYSWDATQPGTITSGPKIAAKAGCAAIQRPDGGNAGIKALDTNTFDGKTTHYCIDFARTASGRSATSPKFGSGGVAYVAYAEDAVTYAVRDTGAAKGKPQTYAPKSLTLAQLAGIYLCRDTNWDQVGGPNEKIHAYIPSISASATATFWLKALGLTSPGSCVNQSLEQNQGLSKQFDDPSAIFIYSVADWVAQKYHSVAAPNKKPAKGQNEFGYNQTGYLGLGDVKVGTKVYSPLTTAKVPTINKSFSATKLTRTIYDVVRYTTLTSDHILSRLEPFLGRKGYICTNKTAAAELQDYGFLPNAACGVAS
jgi:ABC-type phosphate transport system substrate-binding protein